jgi:hypothetical protein
MLTDADLKYPVILFLDCLVSAYENADDLCHTNMLTIKNRAWEGAEVVDSRLRLLRIEEAVKEKGVGRFRGYNLFFNQWVKARLTLSVQDEGLELDALKDRIAAEVNRNRDFHAAGGDVSEMLAEVRQAGSVEEIARVVF